eukprot:359790-Pleurochrysis_carterae.AAC.2
MPTTSVATAVATRNDSPLTLNITTRGVSFSSSAVATVARATDAHRRAPNTASASLRDEKKKSIVKTAWQRSKSKSQIRGGELPGREGGSNWNISRGS